MVCEVWSTEGGTFVWILVVVAQMVCLISCKSYLHDRLCGAAAAAALGAERIERFDAGVALVGRRRT